MEREWAELSATISRVDARWQDAPRLTYRTAAVVRVHLWSVIHDRPTCWACAAGNWDWRARPKALPDQSTMSRRMRGRQGKRFYAFLDAVAAELSDPGAALIDLKRLDGKPLPVAAHSTDPDARWGRGAGQQNQGYKLHAIRSSRPMPEQWAITPLNVDERVVARRLIQRLDGAGYLLCDGLYDASDLHERAAAVNHQLLGPRRRPGTGLGHRRHSPHRLRALEMLESPAGVNDFGLRLYQQRGQIERDFGNLVSFGGGLQGLPAWVRRIWRVRAWIYGKLLINAVRIRRLQRLRA
jgi:IS5 family transposase